PEFQEAYKTLLNDAGYVAVASGSGKDALSKLESTYFPIVLLDIVMPNMNGMQVLEKIKSLYGEKIEVIMVTGYGTIETAVEAMKKGAFGYIIKSGDPQVLLMEIRKAVNMLLLKAENTSLKGSREKRWYISSKSPKMLKILNILDKISSSGSNVLILGESGVGKEIIARLIHQKSARSKMPFIPINCKAYPYQLLDSELFGYEKGAFTGAYQRRIGKFEEANGGTLFLDEIGEMENDIQVRLLRVLETKRIERLGSNKLINIDFRLICATNKDILENVAEGRFREDFYYRISTLVLHIPPLRERKQDIPGLINFFIKKFSTELKKEVSISKGAIELLVEYDYPGNVRELRNIIERLLVLCDEVITEKDVKENLPGGTERYSFTGNIDYKGAKNIFERKFFSNLLEKVDGNLNEAAHQAGLSKRQLYNIIKKHNL
ncbi:MAG TPA: sigma-54-dependent Fis family transcriptional regulator, partial [Thermoanaerobacterales bacterium]|nr:sigma-54-dependent Fis family transcriptional regulator [Thermoanaerobacterales bacterium]